MCQTNKDDVQQASPFVIEYFELLERVHGLLSEKAKSHDIPLYTLALRFADNIMAQERKEEGV